MMDDEYPCPCEGCDRETLIHDEYCAVCIGEGCGYEVNCQ